ncbi:MAG TPA: sodium:solute symporter family protein [Prolixibacteraceae bacterium]|nr:sodium:solute symporter family protein [Prolixibacteraceae bacterium]
MTWAVLIAYVLILFGMAWKSFRTIKDHQDFFIAHKRGTFLTITGSLLATILGGSAIIGSIDAGRELGWATMWFMICAALGLFVLIPFVGKVKSLGRFTLPDLLENLYGSGAKTLASVLIPLAWLGIVAAQMIAASRILQSFTGLSYPVGVLVSGLVFIFYTLAGGQFSVLKTDLFQSVLILAGLLLITFFSYENLCRVQQGGFTSSPEQSFPFNSGFRPFDLLILLMTYATTFTAGPDVYSRLFSAKSNIVAQKSLIATGIILIPVAGIIGFLSVYGAQCVPILHKGSALIDICHAVLPQWSIPFIVLMFLSVVLSSADTTLLSGSIILTGLIEKGGYGKNSVRKTRVIILLYGMVAIAIALSFHSIIELLLIALSVYSGAFFLPIVAGLCNMKVEQKFLTASVVAGSTFSLAGKIVSLNGLPQTGNYLIVLAFLLNGGMLLIGKKKPRKPRFSL